MKSVHKHWIGVGVVVVAAGGALMLVNRLKPADRSWVRGENPLATISTTYGEIKVRLLRREAPNTVANFVRLARDRKFYDNKTSFHRVSAETGLVMAGYTPQTETLAQRVAHEDNDLVFEYGTVGMWHPDGQPDNNTTVFMITTTRRPRLDGMYTIFGRVVSGMDVVARILEVETTGPDGDPPYTPIEPVMIHSITISGDA